MTKAKDGIFCIIFSKVIALQYNFLLKHINILKMLIFYNILCSYLRCKII